MALIRLNHFSQCLGMAMGLEIVLPEPAQGIGIAASQSSLEDLPVLYLLHGTSDDQTIWQRRTSIERYAATKNLAVVMPTTHLGAYANQKYGGYDYFDYIAKEVPQLCQCYFPISAQREKNFIAGLSMGGYGALKIGMRCGDRFSHVIGLSAGCDRMNTLPLSARKYTTIEALEAGRSQLDETDYKRAMHFMVNFGSAQRYLQSDEDNIFCIAESRVQGGLPMPAIFMSCGSEDHMAVAANREFSSLLSKLNVEHLYYEAPGIHDWLYWDTHIQKALDWLPLGHPG